MRIVAAVGLGLLVAAAVAFEVTIDAPAAEANVGFAAGLFAGAAVYDLCAGLLAYFAPLWIALSRAHPDSTGIAVLNLLLGWTVIGWLIAMIWALSRVPGEAAGARDTAFRS